MTEGGSSIPEVQALLRTLAAGPRAAELGVLDLGRRGTIFLLDDLTPGIRRP